MAQQASETHEATATPSGVDPDTLRRLGRPGAQPAERQSQPRKQGGDKLSSTSAKSTGKPVTRESRAAIERAENEGMVP